MKIIVLSGSPKGEKRVTPTTSGTSKFKRAHKTKNFTRPDWHPTIPWKMCTARSLAQSVMVSWFWPEPSMTELDGVWCTDTRSPRHPSH
jgi:hypothetical protein